MIIKGYGEEQKRLECYNFYKFLNSRFDIIYLHRDFYNDDEINILNNICFIYSKHEKYKVIINKYTDNNNEAKKIKLKIYLKGSETYFAHGGLTDINKQAKYIYVDKNDNIFCVVDILNNFHFSDFIHNERKELYELAKKIIKKHYKNEKISLMQNNILNQLKELNTTKIIEIKTQFDKNAYLKNVKKLLNYHINNIKQYYKNVYSYKIKVLEEMLKEKEREIEEERANTFINALKLIQKHKDIVIENNEIVIKKKIICKFVKYGNKLYNLDTDRFFVKNIHIKISNNVDRVYVEKHYHVNVNSENNVCLKELRNRDIIYVFENIEKFFEICNLDSAFSSNPATKELKTIIKRKCNRGDVWYV